MPLIRPAGEQDVTQLILSNGKAAVNNALPGIIRSFNPESVTCDVDIAILAKLTKAGTGSEDFQRESVSYPILVDIPVVFPRGGGVTLTFPVKEGDECLIVFSSRSIDFWWQNGGVQERADGRVLDLSDAFVILGPQSQAQKISNISTSAAQLRSDDGSAFVEVGVDGNITATTQGSITFNAPTITLNGDVTINGNLSQGMGGRGGSASMLGPVTVTNDVEAQGISVAGHTHGGVQTGNGSTGKPK